MSGDLKLVVPSHLRPISLRPSTNSHVVLVFASSDSLKSHPSYEVISVSLREPGGGGVRFQPLGVSAAVHGWVGTADLLIGARNPAGCCQNDLVFSIPEV